MISLEPLRVLRTLRYTPRRGWNGSYASNISDSEAMDKYSGKLFVIGIIVFVILMCVIGNNDDGFN